MTTSLKEAFALHGIRFGFCASAGHFATGTPTPPRRAILLEHAAVVTTDGGMCMKFTQPTEGTWVYSTVDNLIAAAELVDIGVHGCHASWHMWNPTWLTEANPSKTVEELKVILRQHLKKLAVHYNDDDLPLLSIVTANEGYMGQGIWSNIGTANYIGSSFNNIRFKPENAVVNGDFEDDEDNWTWNTGWSVEYGGFDGWYAECSGNQTSNTYLNQFNAIVDGEAYEVTFDVVVCAAGTVKVRAGGHAGTERGAVGTYTQILISPGTNNTFSVVADEDFQGLVDNIVCTPLGNVLDNSRFDEDEDWNKQTADWTISNGKARCSGNQTAITRLEQTNALTDGLTYWVRYTVSDCTAGGVHVRLGTIETKGATRNQNGTYTEAITASGGTFRICANADFNGNIDNVICYPAKNIVMYNSFFWDDVTGYSDMETENAIELVENGKADGIGIQLHVGVESSNDWEERINGISDFLDDIRDMPEAPLVSFSEVSVVADSEGQDPDAAQAAMFADLAQLAVDYSDIVTDFVVWGILDEDNWRSHSPEFGAPVMFDDDGDAKPCVQAVIDVLEA